MRLTLYIAILTTMSVVAQAQHFNGIITVVKTVDVTGVFASGYGADVKFTEGNTVYHLTIMCEKQFKECRQLRVGKFGVTVLDMLDPRGYAVKLSDANQASILITGRGGVQMVYAVTSLSRE
jgi:hypothetical protein